MLTIKVSLTELFDEEKQEFVEGVTFDLKLEHSLVSLSKWESNFEKPFLKTNKTSDQTLWYVQAMTLNDEVPPEVFSKFSKENYEAVNAYINAQMTATIITQPQGQRPPSREVITAEIIYHWMITLNIPFECQYWHLNRLLTLIQVCNIKSSTPKKMGKRDAMAQQRALNAQRKASMGTRG